MENLTTTILKLTTILPAVQQDVTTGKPSGLRSSESFFSWYDYVLFCLMISLSLGIGIYFGCFGKKQSTKDYLLAGGNMKVLPVAISLVASHCSGVTLLALPSEVYMFGANYWLCIISLFFVILTTIYVFLPVFHKLQLTSTYEYLGLRYDRRVRRFGSVLFAISVFLHLPVVTYIPSLAFSAATGLNKYWVIPCVCSVCIIYTAIGGLKALVWSDAVLFTATIGTLGIILGIGVNEMGGIANVFNTAYEGDRMVTFDFSLDFTKRDPFFTMVIGFTVYWIGMLSINQGCTQKFLAVSTLKESKTAVYLFCMGMAGIKTMGVITGLTIYAFYSKCDPFGNHEIEHNNELLPHYVLNVAGHIPGLSGMFIAGVFCASLSALSSNLNSLSGTIYEDFIKPKLSEKSQQNPAPILKLLVVIGGVISTSLVYGVEYLGGLLSLSIGLNSISVGPLLGLFTLGVIFPRATSTGAFYGALVSTITMITFVFTSNYLKSINVVKALHKPVSFEGCSALTNSSLPILTSGSPVTTPTVPAYLYIFKLSFYWYCLLGAVICIVIALIISYMSKESETPVAKELLSPIIYGIIDNDKYVDRLNLDYDSVGEANYKLVGSLLERRPSKWDEMREERRRKDSYISNIEA